MISTNTRTLDPSAFWRHNSFGDANAITADLR